MPFNRLKLYIDSIIEVSRGLPLEVTYTKFPFYERIHVKIGKPEREERTLERKLDEAQKARIDNPPEETLFYKVFAPMVGTFYRAASPTSKPFVEVGDYVRENTTVCIIEAMKLMNEIKTDRDGVVKAIKVKNAQPVEYNQVLFEIDAEAKGQR